MTAKPKKLSNTARVLLTAASARDDHLIQPPLFSVAAARQVVGSLLMAELAEEVPAPVEDAGYVWRKADDGSDLVLRATQLGLACLLAGDDSSVVPPIAATLAESGADAVDALSQEPPVADDAAVDEPQPALDATEARWHSAIASAAAEPADAIPGPPLASTRPARRNGLRQAAQALLAAWDASVSADALDEHFTGLRAALVGLPVTRLPTDDPRPPRDTKRAQVLAMLNRPEGASGPQIAEAMGWASQTVRVLPHRPRSVVRDLDHNHWPDCAASR
jgi:Protein of unknown function (DUF3489)